MVSAKFFFTPQLSLKYTSGRGFCSSIILIRVTNIKFIALNALYIFVLFYEILTHNLVLYIIFIIFTFLRINFNGVLFYDCVARRFLNKSIENVQQILLGVRLQVLETLIFSPLDTVRNFNNILHIYFNTKEYFKKKTYTKLISSNLNPLSLSINIKTLSFFI